ncbi:MAG: transcription antitermination factor NusB [Clostridia bacterium]|nr:transcription antitermination factor NusB [Clostridia bacterium]
MTRSEAREQAFFVLFEKSFCEDLTINEILETAQEADLIKVNNFAKILLGYAEENAQAIDDIITANLRGWTIQRLPKVSLSVLRLAVSEIKFVDEVPAGVTVNEAVELVKKYGTAEDASYVNGVLGSVVKGL